MQISFPVLASIILFLVLLNSVIPVLPILLMLAGLTVLLVPALNIYEMYRDPNYSSWPGITRCQLCEKRIFAWQRRERRPSNVNLNNPDRILVHVAASSIVHKDCKGNPTCHVGIHVG